MRLPRQPAALARPDRDRQAEHLDEQSTAAPESATANRTVSTGRASRVAKLARDHVDDEAIARPRRSAAARKRRPSRGSQAAAATARRDSRRACARARAREGRRRSRSAPAPRRAACSPAPCRRQWPTVRLRVATQAYPPPPRPGTGRSADPAGRSRADASSDRALSSPLMPASRMIVAPADRRILQPGRGILRRCRPSPRRPVRRSWLLSLGRLPGSCGSRR